MIFVQQLKNQQLQKYLHQEITNTYQSWKDHRVIFKPVGL